MKIVKEHINEEENDFKWIKNNKTHEDIIKSIEGKPLENIFLQAIENNQIWLVKYCLDNGIITHDNIKYDYYFFIINSMRLL